MPELPEVQTTVDGLNKTVKGLTIADVWTSYDSAHYRGKEDIKDPEFFIKFKKAVIGAKIAGAMRRAKNILISLSSGQTILIHMKMTGHLMFGTYKLGTIENENTNEKDPWRPTEEGPLSDPFNRHIRLVFTFANGKNLVLSDMRKFAKITLIPTETLLESPHLFAAGPEPLDDAFTFPVFKERVLRRPKGKIKTVLMDQTVLAGVGNIYSDEALWRAGIHPEEHPDNIPEDCLKKLYVSVKEVLKQGIDFGGDSMSDYRNINGERGEFQSKHQAYRRTGKPCQKKGCAGTILRKVVGGRSAHFCSEHQKLRGVHE